MTKPTAPSAPSQPAKAAMQEIHLETPIQRGETAIDRFHLRKPKAGELRGLQLDNLIAGDVNAVMALLPRITVPPILAEEAEQLDMPDLLSCGGAIKGFFMSKEAQTAMARFMGIVETEESTG